MTMMNHKDFSFYHETPFFLNGTLNYVSSASLMLHSTIVCAQCYPSTYHEGVSYRNHEVQARCQLVTKTTRFLLLLAFEMPIWLKGLKMWEKILHSSLLYYIICLHPYRTPLNTHSNVNSSLGIPNSQLTENSLWIPHPCAKSINSSPCNLHYINTPPCARTTPWILPLLQA